jgi:signal transduction histidine kinase/HPt (histidine-containing phosphotransfer) domain-containing protein/ActR/RegA family two-component response regulator
LFVAATFAGIVIIGGYFGRNLVESYLVSYGEKVINASAETLQTYIDGHLAKFEDMAFIVEDLHNRGADPLEIEAELSRWEDRMNADNDRYHGVLFIYGVVDGVLVHGTPWDIPDDFEPRARIWYVGAYDHPGEIYFSNPYIDSRSEDWVLSMSQVLYDADGSDFGVLSFDILFTVVADYIRDMEMISQGFGALVDSELRFLVHPDESLFGRRMDEIESEADDYQRLAALMRGGEELNAYQYTSIFGVDSVLFSRQLYNGWHIYMSTPYTEYNRDVNAMLAVLAVTGIVATLVLWGILTLLYLARRRSDEANRFKSSFLANMSHEIRTPMNAIIGMTELLTHSELSERDRDYVNDINVSAHALLAIINDILDLSKIEAGKLTLNPVHYDFRSLVDNVASMFTYMAKKKGLEFCFESEGELPLYLYGDDIKLRQVLTNICGNAIKFTDKGYVKLRVAASQGAKDRTVTFAIEDTGMGIRKEDIANVFNAFEQSRTDQNRSIVGTGLGLAISKIFVEMMGGTVSLASEYGQGSVFTIVIPVSEGDAMQAEHLGREESLRPFKAPDAQILVVDDNEYNLKVAHGMMALFGIDAQTVLSGKEAIEAVQSHDFDLVFMDHMMPEMDGIETTARIRKLGGKYKDLKIIALTANAIKGAMEMFLENDFDGFIPKPIEMPRLTRALRDWLPEGKIVMVDITDTAGTVDGADDASVGAVSLSPARGVAYNRPLAAADGAAGLGVVPPTTAPDPFWTSLDNIHEINAEIGIGRLDGRKEMYRDILQLFHKKIAEEADKMTVLMAENDLSGFAISVHSMKSGLASIGAMHLSGAAQELETAAKGGDAAYCMAEFPGFCDKLLALYGQLKELFPAAAAQASARAPGDPALLQKTIDEALTAIRDYDADTGLAALEALLAYDFGEETDSLLENAATALKKYEYEKAIEVLEEATAK